MIDSILDFANQSAAISEILPPLIRWSISLVIAFAFSIPLMLVAWLLAWSSTPMIKALIARSRVWQSVTGEAALQCSNRAAEAMKAKPDNQTFIPLNVPLEYTKPVELGSLENAIKQLGDVLKRSPDLKDRDPIDKQKAADELVAAIDSLNSSQSLVRTPQIPKVSEEDAISKFKKGGVDRFIDLYAS